MDSNTPNTDTLGTEKVRWDLGRYFYTGIGDPQIDRDVETLIAMYKVFNETHKGKLAETLGQAMRDDIQISMHGNKLAYIGLLLSLNVSDPVVKAKEAEIDTLTSSAYGKYCEFFKIELAALDSAVCERWYEKDELVRKHKSLIEKIRRDKPHMLSEPVEGILTKLNPFGQGAWSELIDEFLADMEFEFGGEKKTFEEMLDTLTNSFDVNERAEALRLINEKLGGWFTKYAAQTLWITAGGNAVDDEERGYAHPMRARNMSNGASDAMVDALHNAVKNIASPYMKRFYRLKAKHLGLETLRWSDRNAPLPFSNSAKIPFDVAMDTVISAYESFSPQLAEKVRMMRDEKRIDAFAMKGKADGAYCNWVVLPGDKPVSFTFLSYLGSSRDVMTLAHEVGHGGHGELAGEAQGTLLCTPPSAYAETASIFGEMTTFNFLKKNLLESGDKKALLAFLMKKLDDSANTTVRQIGFSNFERRLHGMNETYSVWKKPEKRSAEELDALWLATAKELYGEDGEIFTYENAEHLWSYISHFHAYNPFYVYSYPFGDFLVQSLYAVAPKFGAQFAPLYLEVLKAGSTKEVVELLAPFGLDPTNEEFWANGIHISMGALLKEAEELSAEMGIAI